jgi:hypothetical protein
VLDRARDRQRAAGAAHDEGGAVGPHRQRLVDLRQAGVTHIGELHVIDDANHFRRIERRAILRESNPLADFAAARPQQLGEPAIGDDVRRTAVARSAGDRQSRGSQVFGSGTEAFADAMGARATGRRS